MKLNTIKSTKGSRVDKKRPGRGIGSGLGKTGGRGHKGQLSRSGGGKPGIGFEGGQTPLQRRLPKFGFTSRRPEVAELHLSSLEKLDAKVIDLDVLKAAKIIKKNAKSAKVLATGELTKAVNIKGLAATKAAKEKIEALGGKVEA